MRKTTEKKIMQNMRYLKERLSEWDMSVMDMEKVNQIRILIDANTATHKHLKELG